MISSKVMNLFAKKSRSPSKISALKEKLLSFCYPPLCFHCERLLDKRHLLCESCLADIGWLTHKSRCKSCFNESLQNYCSPLCQKSMQQSAYLFEEGSIGANLVQKLAAMPTKVHLQTLASLIFLQTERLEWSVYQIEMDLDPPWLKKGLLRALNPLFFPEGTKGRQKRLLIFWKSAPHSATSYRMGLIKPRF